MAFKTIDEAVKHYQTYIDFYSAPLLDPEGFGKLLSNDEVIRKTLQTLSLEIELACKDLKIDINDFKNQYNRAILALAGRKKLKKDTDLLQAPSKPFSFSFLSEERNKLLMIKAQHLSQAREKDTYLFEQLLKTSFFFSFINEEGNEKMMNMAVNSWFFTTGLIAFIERIFNDYKSQNSQNPHIELICNIALTPIQNGALIKHLQSALTKHPDQFKKFIDDIIKKAFASAEKQALDEAAEKERKAAELDRLNKSLEANVRVVDSMVVEKTNETKEEVSTNTKRPLDKGVSSIVSPPNKQSLTFLGRKPKFGTKELMPYINEFQIPITKISTITGKIDKTPALQRILSPLIAHINKTGDKHSESLKEFVGDILKACINTNYIALIDAAFTKAKNNEKFKKELPEQMMSQFEEEIEELKKPQEGIKGIKPNQSTSLSF